MLDAHRDFPLFRRLEKETGKIFSFLPLTPNQYTLISLAFAALGFYFLLKESLSLAILFFVIASILDLIDGAVARYKNIPTKVGAYLDTICDRYIEGILLLGLMFLSLPAIFLPSQIWIFFILFGSFMTTYAKAAAKEKEVATQELRGGILSRGERMLLLLISLVLGIYNFDLMVYLLILTAVLTNLTALQRIGAALKKSNPLQ